MAISTLFPTTRPSLSLDFAKSRRLDPRISFSRAQTGSIASYTDSNGLIRYAGPDEPRFDHDPATGESLGLLVEEGRTNLFQYNHNPAAAFSGTATKTTVQIVLPSGETGPALETAVDGFAENYENLTATSNTSPGYLTFYAKKKSSGSTGTLIITMEGGDTGRSFNSININSDTWTKISTTHDWSAATGTLRRFDIYLPSANASDGDTSFYAAFFQFEEGTFPTSYIPTSGSTVTRPADNISITGTNFSEWYNDNEGTLTVRWETYTPNYDVYDNARSSVISLNGGTALRGYYLDYFKIDGRLTFGSRDNTNNQIAEIGSHTKGDIVSTSISYSLSSDTISGLSSVNTSVINNTLYEFDNTTLTIGNFVISGSNSQSQFLNGYIKQLYYYPSKLSNSQLQTLTKQV